MLRQLCKLRSKLTSYTFSMGGNSAGHCSRFRGNDVYEAALNGGIAFVLINIANKKASRSSLFC
jgi:hypothetical protein